MPENEIYLTTHLDGPLLIAANRVLARFNLPQRDTPCTVATLLNGIAPMELGRFCEVLERLTGALATAREFPELLP